MYRFPITIFLSAFLLFQVQPLISKRILPWFGGSPAVWTTCMLFFQLLLLGGYVYAHLISTRLGQRRQVMTHLAVLGLAVPLLLLLFLPLFFGGFWKPADPSLPTWRIAWLLAATVGLPFFVLSSTSPLLQKWYLVGRPQGRVYRLYSLSNIGSLLALVTFPVVMEPFLSTRALAVLWATGFLAFVLLCAVSGLRVLRPASQFEGPQAPAPSSALPSLLAGDGADAARQAGAGRAYPFPSPAALAAAAGVRFHHAPGGHQRDLPGRGGDALPVGAAAGTLPALVHHLLRQRALVLPSGLLAADGGDDRADVPPAGGGS